MSGFRFRDDMTKDEAVGLLQKIQSTPEHLEVNTADLHDALGMAIEALLTERPHGKWTLKDHSWGYGDYECSNCEKLTIAMELGNPFDFCPNCGADMRGDAND